MRRLSRISGTPLPIRPADTRDRPYVAPVSARSFRRVPAKPLYEIAASEVRDGNPVTPTRGEAMMPAVLSRPPAHLEDEGSHVLPDVEDFHVGDD